MQVPESHPDWTRQYHDAEVAAQYDRRYRGPVRRLNNHRIWCAVQKELVRAAGGQFPELVVDVPAGTGRYTDLLRRPGTQVLSLDLSPTMLHALRRKHGPGWELVADLGRNPLQIPTEKTAVALCLRLMQHFQAEQRIAALHGIRQIAPAAVIAYYPGWDYKNRLRRLRQRLGLNPRLVREKIAPATIEREVHEAGWNIRSMRRVFPLLSENVLLTLDRA
jgi:SAM-dependent methyltransferase